MIDSRPLRKKFEKKFEKKVAMHFRNQQVGNNQKMEREREGREREGVFARNELLQEILLNVPADHLVQVCKLVCSNWRDLLNSVAFWRAYCHRVGQLPSSTTSSPAAAGASVAEGEEAGTARGSAATARAGAAAAARARTLLDDDDDDYDDDNDDNDNDNDDGDDGDDDDDEDEDDDTARTRAGQQQQQQQQQQQSIQSQLEHLAVMAPIDRPLTSWRLTNGGNGWEREEGSVLASSYGWCTMALDLPLLRWGLACAGRRLRVTVQADVCTRSDCGGEVKLFAFLYPGDPRHLPAPTHTHAVHSSDSVNMFAADPSHEQRIVAGTSWFHKSCEADFDVTGTLRLIISAKDTQFWAGHYGAKIRDATCTLTWV